jgi:glutamine cyclotransferase
MMLHGIAGIPQRALRIARPSPARFLAARVFMGSVLVALLATACAGNGPPQSSLATASPLATAAPLAMPSGTAPAAGAPAATPASIAASPLATVTILHLPSMAAGGAPAVAATAAISAAIPAYTYRVVQAYPHDPAAFTEGLVYQDGYLYESTGLQGQSSLRKVELATGRVVQILRLPDQYFGEGIAVYDHQIVQLTWTSHIGFVYDEASFRQLGTFTYPSEGWGLTYDGQNLIMSDGTPTLHFLDPRTFAETRRVSVFDDTGPVFQINSLDYIQGQVYANIWQTDRIARIDPQSGAVVGWIDLTGLLGPADRQRPVDVLNGIAWDPQGQRLFVTGKLWPKLFQIELEPK